MIKYNKNKGAKKILSIFSLTLAFIMAFLTLVGCGSDETGGEINLLSEDISKYISVSESDYKSFPVKDVFYDVTDFDVDVEILKLLYSNRNKTPLYDGKYYRNKTISVGDEVFLYYRGYTVDENGKETDFDGGCNFFSSSAHQLGIGSGGFVSGFEFGLVGKLPSEHPTLDIIDKGTVEEGDVIFLSYKVISPDLNASKSNVRIDLSEDIDAIYGAGFKDFLLGGEGRDKKLNVGEGVLGTKIFPVANGSATYYDIKVTGVMRDEAQPIVVDVRFPMDYNEKTLRGKWVKFDVYVEKVQYYETPEFNDAFITDTLKVTPEELEGKEGEGAAEKYKSLIRERLLSENKEKRLSVIEESFWEYIKKKVVVKELPSVMVDGFYNEYYEEIKSQHQLYQAYYPDLESFGQAYYGITDPTVTVSEYMREKAEDATIEKLVFYYIFKAEGLVPNGDFLKKEADLIVEGYLENYLKGGYKSDYEACKTDEERAAFRADLKVKIVDNYGKEYFEEMVYYDIFMEKIEDFALIA